MERLKIVKYINDAVYGGIGLTELEVKLIDTPIFQRLRKISQLGRVNYVFPGAEHSRFVHSLGVLHIMSIMTEHLMRQGKFEPEDAVKMRVAALLHDIGHYPFSHLGESVYSYCKDIENANDIIRTDDNEDTKIEVFRLASSHSKSAHHEKLGSYIVKNNKEIVKILEEYDLSPNEIGEIFTGEIGSRNMVYSQLLHSSLDADRLDYLLRDSYQTGVKYGLVDLHYLVRLLMIVGEGDKKTLVCNKKGQHVVEHFLMSRYFHYSQVIHHKTNTAFEGLVKAMYIKLIQNKKFIFNSIDEIEENVNNENFLNFTDSFLEVAFDNYNKTTDDEDFKKLYHMYKNRIRPKVIFEMKDLYSDSPNENFTILKWHLKMKPDEISKKLNTNLWGYNTASVKIEKINGSYSLTDENKISEEDMREAIKLYDPDLDKISYLASDNLSVINKLANYSNEFLRIYIFDDNENNYVDMSNKIKSLIQIKK